jgi:alpha-maltose-1-phosphate synthase
LNTLIHRQTALLAKVARKIVVNEVVLGAESGFEEQHKVVFSQPRIVDYRADVNDIADYLMELMTNPTLRAELGKAGRKRVVENFDYRVVAKRFVQLINEKLGIY